MSISSKPFLGVLLGVASLGAALPDSWAFYGTRVSASPRAASQMLLSMCA